MAKSTQGYYKVKTLSGKWTPPFLATSIGDARNRVALPYLRKWERTGDTAWLKKLSAVKVQKLSEAEYDKLAYGTKKRTVVWKRGDIRYRPIIKPRRKK